MGVGVCVFPRKEPKTMRDVYCPDVVSKYHLKEPVLLEKWLILGLVQGKVKGRVGIWEEVSKANKAMSEGPRTNLTAFPLGKFRIL